MAVGFIDQFTLHKSVLFPMMVTTRLKGMASQLNLKSLQLGAKKNIVTLSSEKWEFNKMG